MAFADELPPHYDVHYTTVLPIITNVDESTSEKIYDGLVEAVNSESWFQFKTHAEYFKLIKNQGPKLKETLYNPEVIKVTAEKLLVGSLIRLEVEEKLMGYEVAMDILSPSGATIYRRERTFNQKNLKLLNNILKFWLHGFTEQTPFDATVIEVNGDSLFIDFPGKIDELFPNRQFVVERNALVLNDKTMKLESRMEEIAYGVVTKIEERHFIGKVLENKGNNKARANDLIVFKVFDEAIAAKNPDYKYRRHDIGDYRQTGKLTLLATSTRVKGDQSTGTFYGFLGGLDLYLPSSLIAYGEISKKVGSVSGTNNSGGKKSTGSGTSLNDSSYKALVGTSFQPKFTKYISYLDLLAGWTKDQYFISGLGLVGVGDVSFSGPTAALRMEHPVYKNLAFSTYFEYNYKPEFQEEQKVLGKAKRSSGYLAQIGLRYQFLQSGYSLETFFRHKSNTAEIKNSNTKLDISNNQILVGVSKYF
jgi:hypothetical protein